MMWIMFFVNNNLLLIDSLPGTGIRVSDEINKSEKHQRTVLQKH